MKQTIVLAFLILFFGCKPKGKSQNEPLKNLKTLKEIIDEEISNFLKPPYTALSGVVYVDGESYQFHFGKLINEKRANNETLHEIGSLTKTYTGIILSQAIQDKKVDLKDDIRMYLDGIYPNLELDNGASITLQHLITHTSGLPMNINCNSLDQKIDEQLLCFESFTKEDFFKELKQVELIDNTGKNYHYSNTGIQLVGYILENIYQLSAQKLIEKYVFSRSGERNTLYAVNNAENISIGKNSDGTPVPLINGFYKNAGGLKSTTNSMSNYIKMYLEKDDPVVKRTMNRLGGTNQHGIAFIWNTYNYDKVKKMLYHSGGTFGHSSWMALYPNQKTGVFLVTNVMTTESQGDLNELSNKIMDKLIK
ncbi:serine hydrolase domain-containing protein [Aquimarina sp. 2201CG5-10]|uniref:serine hydrolase domain-containing protein n=1 Tax=Aquimarina callyspongiae TaxID=3098150 RepID=UPI002AB5A7A6|nr:serine hydrolase domain-containing protein [Aquimarina sp. 2201CG5-10]MDY8137699.1 serine hydrolase domain-containing protein [Aquimarina sp. 2201CG5-10]